MKLKECYALLGVPLGANQGEVRKAYLELVKKTHPDHNSEADAHDKSQAIIQAYRIIHEEITNDKFPLAEDLLRKLAEKNIDNIILDKDRLLTELHRLYDYFKEVRYETEIDADSESFRLLKLLNPEVDIETMRQTKEYAILLYIDLVNKIISLSPNSSEIFKCTRELTSIFDILQVFWKMPLTYPVIDLIDSILKMNQRALDFSNYVPVSELDCQLQRLYGYIPETARTEKNIHFMFVRQALALRQSLIDDLQYYPLQDPPHDENDEKKSPPCIEITELVALLQQFHENNKDGAKQLDEYARKNDKKKAHYDLFWKIVSVQLLSIFITAGLVLILSLAKRDLFAFGKKFYNVPYNHSLLSYLLFKPASATEVAREQMVNSAQKIFSSSEKSTLFFKPQGNANAVQNKKVDEVAPLTPEFQTPST